MNFSESTSVVLSANFHTGALVVNYPFDGPTTGVYSPTPDDDLIVDLALTYSEAHPSMSQSNAFDQGIVNGADWYAVSGGMQDWNYEL